MTNLTINDKISHTRQLTTWLQEVDQNTKSYNSDDLSTAL